MAYYDRCQIISPQDSPSPNQKIQDDAGFLPAEGTRRAARQELLLQFGALQGLDLHLCRSTLSALGSVLFNMEVSQK